MDDCVPPAHVEEYVHSSLEKAGRPSFDLMQFHTWEDSWIDDERWHQSLKAECIPPGVPLSIADGRRLVERYADYHNRVRLHSAMGYVTPLDKREGRERQIGAQRNRKLEEARRQQPLRRQNTWLKMDATGLSSAAGPN